MNKEENIYEKLSEIQNELKVPKGQRNTFSNYNFRSCEDIMETAKPICKKHRTTLKVGDKLVNIGDRYYVEATATLYDWDSKEKEENTAYAREEEIKKGMDASQITGATSSYARKYALNGLFNLDDNKDADTNEYTKRVKEEPEQEAMIQQGQKQYIIGHLKKDGLDLQLKKYKVATIDALTQVQAYEIEKLIEKALQENAKKKEEVF